MAAINRARMKRRLIMDAIDKRVLAWRVYDVLKDGMSSGCADASGLWTYPALLLEKKGEVLWLCLILGTVPLPAKKRTALFRPKAMVVSASSRPEIVRYENFRLGRDPFPSLDWESPVAMYPHKAIGGLTQSQHQKLEGELLSGYAEAAECFSKGQPLPRRFRELYIQLQDPVFLGYLKCLAPDFFAALEAGKAETLRST
jgi:hypothetical protein